MEGVLKTVSQDINKHKTDARKLDMDFQRAEDHCMQLKDELERDVPQDGKLDALKRQLAEAEEEYQHHQGVLTEADGETHRSAKKGCTVECCRPRGQQTC